MLYILGIVIIIAVGIFLFIKAREKFKIIFPIVLVLCVLGPTIFYCMKYYLEKSAFHSFNLAELKRQELIIQTIEFKEFLVQGTDVDKAKGLEKTDTKYTDELSVYMVSGHADVCFTDIKNLMMDEEKPDISTKTLRPNYKNPGRQIPFDIDVIIDEKNIYQVTSFESEPVKLLNYKMDIIKPESTGTERVQNVKQELKRNLNPKFLMILAIFKIWMFTKPS